MLSVIVPVYNASKYLRPCLDSILSQSYPDFEVLLVDDGSTDDSGSICDEYARRDSRVRVFHKTNGGVSSARNLGLDQAQGEHPHNGTGHGNNRHDNHGDIHHGGHHEQEIPTVVVVQEPPQQPMPCPTATFQRIEQLIQNQSFEESKLTIAKQAISNELMTAEQLKSIAQLFTFEDSKLELLKFAYDYCFDPENYYYVNGAFTFSSSIEELNEYITNHH